MPLVKDERNGITRSYDPTVVGERTECVIEVGTDPLHDLRAKAQQIGVLPELCGQLEAYNRSDAMGKSRDRSVGRRKMVLARFARTIAPVPGPDGKYPRNPPTRRTWKGFSDRDETEFAENRVRRYRLEEAVDDAIWTMCMVMADRGCRLAVIDEAADFLSARPETLDRATVMCCGSFWGEDSDMHLPIFHAGPFGRRRIYGSCTEWYTKDGQLTPDTGILFIEDERRPISVTWNVPWCCPWTWR